MQLTKFKKKLRTIKLELAVLMCVETVETIIGAQLNASVGIYFTHQ